MVSLEKHHTLQQIPTILYNFHLKREGKFELPAQIGLEDLKHTTLKPFLKL